jgi:hypothetical protein
MAPGPQGLHKRMDLSCVPEAFIPDSSKELLDCQASKALIHDLRNFVARRVSPFKSCIKLDGYALGLYEAIALAVTEFLQANPKLDRWFRVKLYVFPVRRVAPGCSRDEGRLIP